MGIFDTIGDAFSRAYDSTLGKVVRTVSDGVSSAANWAGGALTTVHNGVTNVGGKIFDKVDKLTDAAINAANGVGKGIGGLGDLMSNPMVIIGGLIAVSIILPKVLDRV